MRITILNGEPEDSTVFDSYVHSFARSLEAADHKVTLLDLRDLELQNCSGCWGCWVKTPGECVKHDDGETINRAAIDSDLVILAAPMVMGFTSTLLKRAGDRLIPLVHPYLVVEGGEVHHRPRYARYPLFGLLLGVDADTDDEDIAITRDMWARTARNIKSKLVFTTVAGTGCSESVVDGTKDTVTDTAPHDATDSVTDAARRAAHEAAKEAAHELAAVA